MIVLPAQKRSPHASDEDSNCGHDEDELHGGASNKRGHRTTGNRKPPARRVNVCRKNGQQKQRQRKAGKWRDWRDQEANRPQDFEDSRDRDQQLRPGKLRWNHANQVGPAPAPVSRGGQQEHGSQRDPQRGPPPERNRNSEPAKDVEQQKRRQEKNEWCHVDAEEAASASFPSYAAGRRTVPLPRGRAGSGIPFRP